MDAKNKMRNRALGLWTLLVAAGSAVACGSDGSQAVDETGGRAGEGGEGAAQTGGNSSGGKGSGGNATGGTTGASTGGMGNGGDSEGGDADVGGASGGAGTGGGPAAGEGGTTTDLPGCVAGPPTAGSNCDDEGYACIFPGSPCGGTARCTDGEWAITTQCPPPPECPPEPPENGTACSWLLTDLGPQNCAYGSCPEGTLGDGEIVASCLSRVWQVDTEACQEAFQCGPETCPEGEICGSGLCISSAVCLKSQLPDPPPEGYGEWYWSCSSNTCGDAEIDCECAETLCGGTNESCTGVVDREITCETL